MHKSTNHQVTLNKSQEPTSILTKNMFAQFTPQHLSQNQKMRGKDQKNFIAQLEQHYPQIQTEELQKKICTLYKMPNRFQCISIDKELKYFNYYDGTWLPMLRTLQQNPDMVQSIVIDEGATRALLSGAKLMAPGVISIPDDFKVNEIYPIRCKSYEPFAYIKLEQSPQQIKEEKRDSIGEIVMIIGDPLWEHGDKVKN